MFLSRNLIYKITRIHEQALRITNDDNLSSFQDLLDKDNSVKTQHKNIKTLPPKTCKAEQELSPPILNKVFVEQGCNYNLRTKFFLNIRRANSVRYGTESASYLAPKIWDILPIEIKDSETISSFKAKRKKMGSTRMSCRLCKTRSIYLNSSEDLKICVALNRLTLLSFSLHFVHQCYYKIVTDNILLVLL